MPDVERDPALGTSPGLPRDVAHDPAEDRDPGPAVPVPGPAALARPGSRVLLVGTGRHPDDSALPAIPQVRPTLEALAAALREQVGVPEANLRLLADPATPLDFGNTLAQAAAEATDALLIYYAGHGLVGRDGALYLATTSTSDLLDGLRFAVLPVIYDLANPAAPVVDASLRTGTTGVAFVPRRGKESPLFAGPCRYPVRGLCLWSLANPEQPAVIATLPFPAGFDPASTGISSLAASPDGLFLAAAAESGATLVWSIADPAHPAFIKELANPVHTPNVAAVAFAPQGDLLATTIIGGDTRLWQLMPVTQEWSPAAVLSGGYSSIAFGPGGTAAASLLTAVGDQSAGLWDVTDPSDPRSFTAIARGLPF